MFCRNAWEPEQVPGIVPVPIDFVLPDIDVDAFVKGAQLLRWPCFTLAPIRSALPAAYPESDMAERHEMGLDIQPALFWKEALDDVFSAAHAAGGRGVFNPSLCYAAGCFVKSCCD
jgi:hypothetical protein